MLAPVFLNFVLLLYSADFPGSIRIQITLLEFFQNLIQFFSHNLMRSSLGSDF